jgi:hypothetical protein
LDSHSNSAHFRPDTDCSRSEGAAHEQLSPIVFRACPQPVAAAWEARVDYTQIR